MNISFSLLLVIQLMLAIPLVQAENINGNKNEKEKSSKNDTLPAIFMSGERFLSEHVDGVDEEAIIHLRDSLAALTSPPEFLIRQIDLYLNIRYMTDTEIIHLIDSLFEADDVPYPLINKVNDYVVQRKSERSIFSYSDTSNIPANCFYNGWNTDNPNPYSNDLCKQDSMLYLLLEGRQKDDDFVPPVINTITSPFGWREGRMHKGIDIDLEVWDTVRSAFPGMVRVARFYGGYGRVVVVRHFNGLETLYAHLHRLKVKPGQIVEAGELVGLGGSSGHSTGSHLHFECRFKGIPLNPMSFINFKENKVVNDTLVVKKTDWGYAAYPYGTQFHIVKKGEYLHKIAKQYGTSMDKICELNGIRRNTTLYVGQKLRI